MSLPFEEPDESPGTLLIHHAVVPAAIIAMVASLLFYLVDVRSAFLGGGPQLKWVGFCFVMGTVLIERYGRASSDAESQGCYTLFLAGAMAMVILAAPWQTGPERSGGKLANLVIVAAVWFFATRVTRQLSPELGRPPRLHPVLLGVERLTMQAWQAERARQTGAPPPPTPETAEAAPAPVLRNPAVSVAGLAAAALLAFALGEPVLLQAAPQTGVRALAAVVVFLFSTGVVLSAAATLHTLRRVERQGGWASSGLLPRRLALAAVFLLAVLAAGLAMPGLDFQGTGRLRPPTARGKGTEKNRGYQQTDQVGKLTNKPVDDAPNEAVPEPGPDEARRFESEIGGPAGSLLGFMATIGKWLLLPLALGLFVAGVLALVRLWPLLAAWRARLAGRWRSFLERLRRFFSWSMDKKERGADPLADLDGLALLPPREAVLAAYQRFLGLLDRLGHPRPEKATPYELLNALPADLRYLEASARTLTELYVRAAYADEPVEPGTGGLAVKVLMGMRGLVAGAQ